LQGVRISISRKKQYLDRGKIYNITKYKRFSLYAVLFLYYYRSNGSHVCFVCEN